MCAPLRARTRHRRLRRNRRPFYLLGIAHSRANALLKAIAALETRRRSLPDDVNVYRELGYAYEVSKQYAKALSVSAWRGARAFRPDLKESIERETVCQINPGSGFHCPCICDIFVSAVSRYSVLPGRGGGWCGRRSQSVSIERDRRHSFRLLRQHNRRRRRTRHSTLTLVDYASRTARAAGM